MFVLLWRKCTLAASHSAPGDSRWVCAACSVKARRKMGQTDGRTPDGCIMLTSSARRGQRNEFIVTDRCNDHRM